MNMSTTPLTSSAHLSLWTDQMAWPVFCCRGRHSGGPGERILPAHGLAHHACHERQGGVCEEGGSWAMQGTPSDRESESAATARIMREGGVAAGAAGHSCNLGMREEGSTPGLLLAALVLTMNKRMHVLRRCTQPSRAPWTSCSGQARSPLGPG